MKNFSVVVDANLAVITRNTPKAICTQCTIHRFKDVPLPLEAVEEIFCYNQGA